MDVVKKFRYVGCSLFVLLFVSIQSAFSQNLEAENLTRTASATGAVVATNQSGASNNAFVYLSGTPNVNDWMQFTIPNVTAGTYSIRIYFKGFYNRGIAQFSIDGQNIGSTCDMYNANQVNQSPFDVGTTTLSGGNHLLRCTVVGKNNSSAGYLLTLDNLVLTQVASPPEISVQPQDQTVDAGQTATFSVTATGTAPLSYQWRKNGVNIPNATAATHTTIATVAGDNGALFSCVVSNQAGSVTSDNAVLTVNVIPPPVITADPENQTVLAGQPASFSVTATGTEPLSYQWRRNGVNISGATAATYTIPATVAGDNGALFACVVSNQGGSVISNNAELTVNEIISPVITAQPQNLSVLAGEAATFSVTATGTAPLTYQWRRDGNDITNATSSSYTIQVTAAGDDGAQFSCMVSNQGGSVISNNATLTVTVPLPPQITAQPQNRTVLEGATATFSVTATGTAPLTYQWRRDGTSISGATAASYTTPAVTMTYDSARFSCAVTNAYGNVTSDEAVLFVESNPRLHDSLALVAFYTAAGGSAWTNRTNWLTTHSIDTWYGVTVTSDRVTKLSFPADNNLAGTLSDALGDLTALEVLFVEGGQQLQGTLPAILGNLTSLDTLHIQNTAIAGAIPQTLSALTALEVLDLGQNRIVDVIPEWVGTLTNLQRLNLSSNNLSGGIPAVIGSLAALRQLFLQDNNLGGPIPAELGNLSNLTVLDLWGNGHTGTVPGAIGRLPALQEIMLERNELTSINDSVARLTGLTYCGLAENRFCNLSEVVSAWADANDPDWAQSQTCSGPVIEISASPRSGAVPLDVQFTATNVGQSAVYTWAWSFGDGGTADVQNPQHTYAAAGSFTAQCIASGIGGSDTATLSIQAIAPPVITTQPLGQSVTETETATFSVVASGAAPLTYQWRRNGTEISGATAAAYTTPAVTLADNGAVFSCVVSNAVGSVTSSDAILTVNAIAPPVIVTDPADQLTGVGRTATFSVVATGFGTLGYQWLRNDAPVAGATAASYTTPPATLDDDGTRFSCVVSNAGGSVTSTDAVLSVTLETPPAITADPGNVWVSEGQTATLSVTASGSLPLTYQWKKGEYDVGTGSPTFTLQAVTLQDAGAYRVIVTNTFGADTSASAMITVLPADGRFNSQKLSINGELRDAAGNPVGSGTPATIPMTLRVLNSDVGGAALYTESFRTENQQGVVVDNGLFTVRLGEGTTSDNLAEVLASNPHLWVEIVIEGATADTLHPRTPLTSAGQSMVSAGMQPLHGSGTPEPALSNVIGRMYIDDASGMTWIRTNSGWHQLQ